MAKKVVDQVKLQINAGAANPSPPVGPALGQRGVNIMEFCKQFNAKTQGMGDVVIPVVITVYADRSFTFVTKTPPSFTAKPVPWEASAVLAPKKLLIWMTAGRTWARTSRAPCEPTPA